MSEPRNPSLESLPEIAGMKVRTVEANTQEIHNKCVISFAPPNRWTLTQLPEIAGKASLLSALLIKKNHSPLMGFRICCALIDRMLVAQQIPNPISATSQENFHL